MKDLRPDQELSSAEVSLNSYILHTGMHIRTCIPAHTVLDGTHISGHFTHQTRLSHTHTHRSIEPPGRGTAPTPARKVRISVSAKTCVEQCCGKLPLPNAPAGAVAVVFPAPMDSRGKKSMVVKPPVMTCAQLFYVRPARNAADRCLSHTTSQCARGDKKTSRTVDYRILQWREKR